MAKVTGGWRSGARGLKGNGTWRRLDELLKRARPSRNCAACGRRISITRLRALPHTEFCTACQVARESEPDAGFEPRA
jgi:RNA polymerase-binding transcription factor DksA